MPGTGMCSQTGIQKRQNKRLLLLLLWLFLPSNNIQKQKSTENLCVCGNHKEFSVEALLLLFS